MQASADTLSRKARDFFERTKSKLSISIIIAIGCMVLLAQMVIAAGNVQAENDSPGLVSKVYGSDDVADIRDGRDAYKSGFGFASFFYILGVIFMLFGSIYYSPLFCGSEDENTTLREPKEDVYSNIPPVHAV
jgi:hypothetical protein